MRDNIKGGALTETTLLVLLALYEPRHGYEVNKYIEEVTHGRTTLGAGTLYKVINTLHHKQWIKPFGNKYDRKNIFLITELGKVAVEAEKVRLTSVLDLVEAVAGG